MQKPRLTPWWLIALLVVPVLVLSGSLIGTQAALVPVRVVVPVFFTHQAVKNWRSGSKGWAVAFGAFALLSLSRLLSELNDLLALSRR